MNQTPRNPGLRRQQVETDLAFLHRERWDRIAAELGARIAAAQGAERDALEAELDRHYEDRFNPESSRAALLAEAGADGED